MTLFFIFGSPLTPIQRLPRDISKRSQKWRINKNYLYIKYYYIQGCELERILRKI